MKPTHVQLRAWRIVSSFLDSRYWENAQFGTSSDDWLRDSERMERCTKAAEHGADGSTHREVIGDMREAFRACLRYGRRNRRAEYPYRIEAAAMQHFDELEAWHERNSSLDQEIG